MTYDKETRDERNEKAHEIDDGAFDTWIGENKEDLIAEFIDEYNSEWISFCKTKWNELNE